MPLVVKENDLRLFHTPRVIPLQLSWLDRARVFAKAVIQTTNYQDSYQSNKQKIQQDHFISKLGEEAVKEVFTQLGQKVAGPDYTIYSAQQKSWQSDLVINNTELAIKTQSLVSAQKYSVSWLFQSGSKRYDHILNKPKAWVCFVSYGSKAQTCTVYPPMQIKDLVFKEPKLEYLKDSKKAVYLEDLLTTNLITV
jgi:hypothetical protein